MTPQAVATINTAALRHNLHRVRQYAPESKVLAVIKANAYGHGITNVIQALSEADAFAVGTFAEAQQLRKQLDDKTIVILQGFTTVEELFACRDNGFQPVVHSEYQLEMLQTVGETLIKCWVKIDTGMHRLGLSFNDEAEFEQRLNNVDALEKPVTIMSHFACADEPEREENYRQMERYTRLVSNLNGEQSLCNSAGIVSFPTVHGDWVRPGIMLYGISPLKYQSAQELDLQPVMTLKSRLISINHIKAGEAIGYGATWKCPEDMLIGVIGIGYGDGYPRHAPSGTPVLIRDKRCPLVGRVSMDLLTVDLRGQPEAVVGDEVTLWGDGLPIEEIAESAATIGYELVCRLTSRIAFRTI